MEANSSLVSFPQETAASLVEVFALLSGHYWSKLPTTNLAAFFSFSVCLGRFWNATGWRSSCPSSEQCNQPCIHSWLTLANITFHLGWAVRHSEVKVRGYHFFLPLQPLQHTDRLPGSTSKTCSNFPSMPYTLWCTWRCLAAPHAEKVEQVSGAVPSARLSLLCVLALCYPWFSRQWLSMLWKRGLFWLDSCILSHLCCKKALDIWLRSQNTLLEKESWSTLGYINAHHAWAYSFLPVLLLVCSGDTHRACFSFLQ